MAGLEGWEKEDLAGKVIPSVGICLVDKEKSVRDQGFRAIDMFVRKCEVLTASMVRFLFFYLWVSRGETDREGWCCAA